MFVGRSTLLGMNNTRFLGPHTEFFWGGIKYSYVGSKFCGKEPPARDEQYYVFRSKLRKMLVWIKHLGEWNVCGKEHPARDEQHRCFSVHTLENVCGKKHLWELNVVGRSTLLGMTYTGCFSVHTLKNVCGNRMFSNGFQNNLFPPEIW